MAWAAQAEAIQVLDLRLQPVSGWLSAPAAEVEEADAWTLSWPGEKGVALQVLVPRSPPLLKSDAETFYRNLTRKWQAQYGKAVAVGWGQFDGDAAASGGVRWLIGRRPSREHDGVVFHLATVWEGRAYSVLVVAPAGSEALPAEARALMAGAGFGAPPEAPVAVVQPAPAAPRWHRALARVLVPEGEALSGLVQAETDALGDSGMLTGAVFQPQSPRGADSALEAAWSLDGFRWGRQYGRDLQVPFASKGRLTVAAPAGSSHLAATDSEAQTLELTLTLALEATEAPLAVVVEALSYCGPAAPWDDALKALEKGARSPLRRLARQHPCPAGQGAATPTAYWEVHAGEQFTRTFALALPAAGPGLGARWVEVGLKPAPGAVGEALLDQVGVVLGYLPAAAPE